jgi:hypothetical protein
MIIDCAHYHDGRRRDEGPVPLDEAAARCGQGGFVWLGLLEPSEDELAQVRDTFGLHELAVEDAQNFHMRPKIENYDQGVQLVILRTARYDEAAEEVEFGEISIFLAPAFVITVRQGVASELRGARQRLEQRPELLAGQLIRAVGDLGSGGGRLRTGRRRARARHRPGRGHRVLRRLRTDGTDLLAAPGGYRLLPPEAGNGPCGADAQSAAAVSRLSAHRVLVGADRYR